MFPAIKALKIQQFNQELKRSIVTGWCWWLIQVGCVQAAFAGDHSREWIVRNNWRIEVGKLGILANELQLHRSG